MLLKRRYLMTTHNTDPAAVYADVMDDIVGQMKSEAIRLAVQLQLPDQLKDGPKSVADLAQATGTHTKALYRLLYALANCGYFEEVEPYVFAQTERSHVLRSDIPRSLRGFALIHGDKWQLQPWRGAMQTIQTGKPAFPEMFGKDLWRYFAEDDPEAGELFNQASVIETVQQHSFADKFGDRVKLISGNFFEAVPPGGDIYFLKQIIQDWEDPECIQILSHCREAMNKGGRVLVAEEIVVPGKKIPPMAALIDLQLQFIISGGKRSEAEHRALFESSGLRLKQVWPTQSSYSILEAVP